MRVKCLAQEHDVLDQGSIRNRLIWSLSQPIRSLRSRLLLNKARISLNDIQKQVVSIEIIIFAILQGSSKKH